MSKTEGEEFAEIMKLPDPDKPAQFELFSGIGGARHAAQDLGWGSLGYCEINPASVAEYRANFDTSRDFYWPNARTLDTSELPDLARGVVVAGFPCFAAGTLVLTARGYVPIEEVGPGDYVVTHRGRWRRVSRSMRREGAELQEVTVSGARLTTTPEHPFLARPEGFRPHGRERHFGEPGWVEAKDLEGAFAAQVLPAPSGDGADSRTEAFWWLVGRYLADGWRVERRGRPGAGRVVICCRPAEVPELLRRVGEAGQHATVARDRREPSAVKLHLTRKGLYGFLGEFGKGAAGKRLPRVALNLDAPRARALLEGYLSGDGHRDARGWRATTVSRALALGVALLAMRAFGVAARIQENRLPATHIIQGRTVNQRTAYVIDIPDRNRSAFLDGWFTPPDDREVLEASRGWRLCRRSRPLGKTGTVYNLSVEGDESYVAENCVVHNCQAFSHQGHRRGFDDLRGNLFREVARVVRDRRPRAFILENVGGLLTHDRGRTLATILGVMGATVNGQPPLEEWEGCVGYHLWWTVLNSKDYGVAQNRPRFYCVGFRDMADAARFRWPAPEGPRPVLRDVLEPDEKVDAKLFVDEGWFRSHYVMEEGPSAEGEGAANGIKTTARWETGSGEKFQSLRAVNPEGLSPTVDTGAGVKVMVDRGIERKAHWRKEGEGQADFNSFIAAGEEGIAPAVTTQADKGIIVVATEKRKAEWAEGRGKGPSHTFRMGVDQEGLSPTLGTDASTSIMVVARNEDWNSSVAVSEDGVAPTVTASGAERTDKHAQGSIIVVGHRESFNSKIVADEKGLAGTLTTDDQKNMVLAGGRKRYLTARECARLQGFPDSHAIVGNRDDACFRFGNAMTVNTVRAIMRQVGEALAG